MRDQTDSWDKQPASICIGLVNNMPDSALEATERQFRDLLREAESAEGIAVQLSLLAMPEVSRSEKTRRRINSLYLNVDELWNHHLDGLIVTGAEPRAQTLPEEPYWARLACLIDWAERHTYSSIWSCLAAHAAVLRKDGIERRRLSDKFFGVFECAKRSDHPLTADVPSRFRMPHSRWNDVPEEALSACGYRALTRLQDGGVDVFVKQAENLSIFFQGHPEYDADSLLLEYRRDVRRFLNRESESHPSSPQGCCLTNPSAPLTGAKSVWRSDAVRFYRNWLRYLFEQKSARLRNRLRPAEYHPNSVMAAEAGFPVQEAEL